MISEAAVRELATHVGDPAVTTVYLDVDGRHRPVAADYVAAFERLADDLRRRGRAQDDRRLADALEGDLDSMRAWLGSRIDRGTTRGVALFSCSDQGFFEAVPLPLPVHDEAAVGATPRVTQLLSLLDEHERFLVALVDRRRLRLVRVELGEPTELPPLVDPEPRAVDTSIELGGFERHTEEATRIHLRRAADAVRRALDGWPADRLVLAGPDEAVAGLVRYLPAAVAARIAGRAGVRVAAPLREITAAVLDVEEAAERRHERDLVEDLRQRAAGGHGGVVGLEATLASLDARRVGTLVVSEGFTAPGGSCPSCGHVGVDVRQCPRCGSTNVEIDDLVAVAIGKAVAQGAQVEFCRSDELDRFGHIGAIERY